MKKITKRLVAVMLCLIMAVSVIPFSASAANERNIPHIDFRGFMNDPLFADKDNAESDKIWPPSTDSIVSLVAKLLPWIGTFALSNDWNTLGDGLIPALNGLLAPLAYDNTGKAANNSGAYFKYPTAEEVKADKYIPFTYDWRADPFDSAAKLNDLITYLTDDLGYPQVVLECHSYAGIVMLTYLSTYGTSKVKSCVFGASAVYGAGFAGNLVKGDVNIDGEALIEYLKGTFANNDLSKTLAGLLDALKAAGIADTLGEFVNKLFANLGNRLYKECIIPVLGYWPSVWSMVPDQDLAAGMNFAFNDILADSQEDYSALQARIQKFNTNIRSSRVEKLLAVNAGCNVYVFSHYGFSGIPISANWANMGDGVLNSTATSFGGTFKDFNSKEKFEAGKYVSPNGLVDASTALFKDQTWYIRSCKHGEKNDSLSEMAKVLLYTDGQATVDTYEQYPQFMMYVKSGDTGYVTADNYTQPGKEPENENVKKAFNLFDIFNEIINFFKNLFAKLFG